jgi:hypothetical protein
MWTYDGKSIQLPPVKGLRDLAVLIRSPRVDIPAADLVAASAADAVHFGADPILDPQARIAYRQRLTRLDEEEIHADQIGDAEGSRRVQDERQQILETLRAATGLGGRPRLLGDLTERARKAVTARIRDAIQRVTDRHPQLGAHLADSIHTGTTCSYRPDLDISWDVDLTIR